MLKTTIPEFVDGVTTVPLTADFHLSRSGKLDDTFLFQTAEDAVCRIPVTFVISELIVCVCVCVYVCVCVIFEYVSGCL
jgi:hypothetical protein